MHIICLIELNILKDAVIQINKTNKQILFSKKHSCTEKLDALGQRKIDFYYSTEYFAEKHREQVKLYLTFFTVKNRFSTRIFTAFLGENEFV